MRDARQVSGFQDSRPGIALTADLASPGPALRGGPSSYQIERREGNAAGAALGVVGLEGALRADQFIEAWTTTVGRSSVLD